MVALFTRAWIEISSSGNFSVLWIVALFTRAWIEIRTVSPKLLSRRVALFTRAWIEICQPLCYPIVPGSRPLHEGVD